MRGAPMRPQRPAIKDARRKDTGEDHFEVDAQGGGDLPVIHTGPDNGPDAGFILKEPEQDRHHQSETQ